MKDKKHKPFDPDNPVKVKKKKPGLVSGALKSGTVWGALGSAGAFILAASDFIPPEYKGLATAAGGLLSAIAILRARKAGVEAAEKVDEKVDTVLTEE